MAKQWNYWWKIATTWNVELRSHTTLDVMLNRVMLEVAEAGSKGWEMVGYTVNPYDGNGYFVTIIMKRPKKSKKPKTDGIWRSPN